MSDFFIFYLVGVVVLISVVVVDILASLVEAVELAVSIIIGVDDEIYSLFFLAHSVTADSHPTNCGSLVGLVGVGPRGSFLST